MKLVSVKLYGLVLLNNVVKMFKRHGVSIRAPHCPSPIPRHPYPDFPWWQSVELVFWSSSLFPFCTLTSSLCFSAASSHLSSALSPLLSAPTLPPPYATSKDGLPIYLVFPWRRLSGLLRFSHRLPSFRLKTLSGSLKVERLFMLSLELEYFLSKMWGFTMFSLSRFEPTKFFVLVS